MKSSKALTTTLVAAAAILAATGASRAGVLTWTEIAPTGVSTSGGGTESYGSGTDILSTGVSGGNLTSFSASQTAAATFNYAVTWTPSVAGEVHPGHIELIFQRFGYTYQMIGGYWSGPNGTNVCNATATNPIFSLSPYNVTFSSMYRAQGNTAQGSTSMQQYDTWSSAPTLLTQGSGSTWVATVSVPWSVAASMSSNNTTGGQSGCSLAASAVFKQVLQGWTPY